MCFALQASYRHWAGFGTDAEYWDFSGVDRYPAAPPDYTDWAADGERWLNYVLLSMRCALAMAYGRR